MTSDIPKKGIDKKEVFMDCMNALSMLQWYHIFLSLWNKQKFVTEVVDVGWLIDGLVEKSPGRVLLVLSWPSSGTVTCFS